jgi:hypothetical protein
MSSRSIADHTYHREPQFVVGPGPGWPAPLPAFGLDALIHNEYSGTADDLLARHCRLGLSGTLRIDGEPGVRAYLHDGLVYFAERTTDPELGFRLVLDGVINEDQLERGTRLLEGGRHLGHMFANDPTIDSRRVIDAVVGYCTDTVTGLEGHSVSTYAFVSDEHHPSGILAWYSLDEDFAAPRVAAPIASSLSSPSVPEPLVVLEPLVVELPMLVAPTAVEAPLLFDLAAVLDDMPPVAVEVVAPEAPTFAEAVGSTLTDWLRPVEFEPLVSYDDDPEPVVREVRLPRRSRFDEPIPLPDAGLGEVNISALQSALTHMRASSTATLTARETAAPAVRADAPVANEKVPGSPAERRRWMARRHR